MQTRQVARTVYDTIYVVNGKEFKSESEALHHERLSNGTRKKCDKCSGHGYVNGRYEKVTWDYGHSSREDYVTDKCKECNGKGYLEKVTEWK